jgi:hypothetical protein
MSHNGIVSILGWLAIMAFLFRLTNRRRHISRTPFRAFITFAVVFFGITLAALFVTVGFEFATGIDKTQSAAFGPILAVIAVFPAWRLAMRRIATPRTV